MFKLSVNKTMFGSKLITCLSILAFSAITVFSARGITKSSKLTYAKDPRKAKALAVVELNLAKKLSSAVNEPLIYEACINVLYKYLTKFNQAHDSIEAYSKRERAENLVENGLHVYKLIFRVVTLLEDVNRDANCKKHIQKLIDQEFSAARAGKPGHKDLTEALLGILRNQYVYGFNATSQLQFGIFGEINTGSKLDFDECLEIAHKAISMEVNELAYQWLAAATQVASGFEEESELDKAWQTLAFQYRLNCTDRLHVRLQGVPQTDFPGMSDYPRYASCRGEYGGSPYKTVQHELFCYYHRTGNWYYAVNPVKTEMLSREPLVLEYHGFINENTINFLKNSGYKDRFRGIIETRKDDGLTAGFNEFVEWLEFMEEYGEFLTSVDFEMRDDLYDPETFAPELTYLDKRMEALTGLVIDTQDTQMLLYSALGGHYDIHHDSTVGSNLYNKETGDRIANFFMALTDIKLGGYLAFPSIGVHVKPKKGNAVLWFNCLKNCKPDMRSFHTGCPVILGSKQIARMGIYQNDNMWARPCDLDPNK